MVCITAQVLQLRAREKALAALLRQTAEQRAMEEGGGGIVPLPLPGPADGGGDGAYDDEDDDGCGPAASSQQPLSLALSLARSRAASACHPSWPPQQVALGQRCIYRARAPVSVAMHGAPCGLHA
jgi:hypothetical protein